MERQGQKKEHIEHRERYGLLLLSMVDDRSVNGSSACVCVYIYIYRCISKVDRTKMKCM